MGMPLALLALGAVPPASRSSTSSSASGYRASSGQVRSFEVPQQPHPARHARGPDWVGWAPTVAMAAAASRCPIVYYIRSPPVPVGLARASAPLYLFLLNKWYFDELYDCAVRAPGDSGSADCCGKGGDGKIIDGLGPDGIAGRVLWTTGRVVKLQTGYVYHYAFAMLIGVALIITAFMFAAERRMTSTGFGRFSPSSPSSRWPARCSLRFPQRGRDPPQRALDRALDHDLHLRASLFLWADFDPATAGFQFVEDRTGSAAPSPTRWASTASRCCSWCSPPSSCRCASWQAGRHQERVKEYMIAFLVLETLMIGVFSALDLIIFYLFFEGGLIPMFLIIGMWGGQAPRLCQLQVLPLYAAGLAADAARHHGDVLARGHHRHSPPAHPQVPAGDADLAVVRLLRVLRREAADVAGAHLASRRPRRGADRGFRDPRRHPLEDGRLRLPALLDADVSARRPSSRR